MLSTHTPGLSLHEPRVHRLSTFFVRFQERPVLDSQSVESAKKKAKLHGVTGTEKAKVEEEADASLASREKDIWMVSAYVRGNR